MYPTRQTLQYTSAFSVTPADVYNVHQLKCKLCISEAKVRL